MAEREDMLVQVTAPHFCAALELTDGVVTRTAPILHWAMGWKQAELSSYFRRKGWRAIIVRARDD